MIIDVIYQQTVHDTDGRLSALHVCQFVREFRVTVRIRCHIRLLHKWISLHRLKSTKY